jgi:hypothetical protein
MGHCRLPCRHHENYLEPSSEIEEETEKMGNKNRKKQQCRKKKKKKEELPFGTIASAIVPLT